ncbi:MAG: TIM barrel protein [Planctomycetota bacterium]
MHARRDGKLRLAMESGRDLRSSAEAAGRRQFDALSVEASAIAGLDSASARRELRATLSKHGLQAGVLRHRVSGRGLSETCDVDRFVDELAKSLTAARDCGFACVACDLGQVPSRPTTTPAPKAKAPDAGLLILPGADEIAKFGQGDVSEPSKPADADHVALAEEALRVVATHADRLTLPVAFGTTLASDDDLSALLSAVDCRLFGRELDPASSLDALSHDVASVVALTPPLLHVVGSDAQGHGVRQRACKLGEGDVPWAELADVLRQADFGGFVTLPHGAPAALPA